MSLEESGVILVDKPIQWTSFSAVNKIKYLLKYQRKQKVKVGHAGTLDPLATGLLIVCYGKMTKQISSYQALFKEYTGEIKLGATTPSYDLETPVDQEYSIEHISEDLIAAAAKSMTGIQMQRPPDFSAKSIGGVRAYTLARKGEKTNIKENEIEVFEFDTKFVAPDIVEFKIKCSKGTYIRSMAHDLGKKLNSGGHLISLRRTAIGDYRIEDALTIEELEAQFKSNSE